MTNRIYIKNSTTSVRNFVENYSEDTTLFLPSIQRDFVWGKKNKDGYYEAILRNMTPTPIILADIETAMNHAKHTNNMEDYQVFKEYFEEGKQYISIDGGNRTKYLNERYEMQCGMFKNMSDELKTFFQHEIQVSVYMNLTFFEMHEMAGKVNMGVPWNKADKRNVLPGPIAQYVRHLTNQYSPIFGEFLTIKEMRTRKVDETLGYYLAYHQTNPDGLKQDLLDALYLRNHIDHKDQFEIAIFLWSKVITIILDGKYKVKKTFSLNLFIYLTEMYREHGYKLNFEVIEDFAKKYVELEETRIIEKFEVADVTCAVNWNDWQRYSKDLSKKYSRIYNDMLPFVGDYFISLDRTRVYTEDEKIEMFVKTNGVVNKLDGTSEKISVLQALNGKEYHADHIKPYSKGGQTTVENGQLLRKKDNLKKSNKVF